MKKAPIIPTPCPKCGCPLIIEATPADGGPKEIFCVRNAEYKRKEHA